MKKTIWAISILALAVALSFLYRFGFCPHRLVDFPVLEDQKKINSPFSLYFFFSRHSPNWKFHCTKKSEKNKSIRILLFIDSGPMRWLDSEVS